MSDDVVTEFGVIRQVQGHPDTVALRWCDTCEDWSPLNTQQFNGALSDNHAATGCPSGYHETHDFANAVADVLLTRASEERKPG